MASTYSTHFKVHNANHLGRRKIMARAVGGSLIGGLGYKLPPCWFAE